MGGEAKYNPNVKLAKEGKLPPKPHKLSKKEQRRLDEEIINNAITDYFFDKFDLPKGGVIYDAFKH